MLKDKIQETDLVSKTLHSNKMIYELDLHESMDITLQNGSLLKIVRVIGGWIYSYEYMGFNSATSSMVFVPYLAPKEDVTKELSKIISPENFRSLAIYLDKSDKLLNISEGTQVQDDLRAFAQKLENLCNSSH